MPRRRPTVPRRRIAARWRVTARRRIARILRPVWVIARRWTVLRISSKWRSAVGHWRCVGHGWPHRRIPWRWSSIWTIVWIPRRSTITGRRLVARTLVGLVVSTSAAIPSPIVPEASNLVSRKVLELLHTVRKTASSTTFALTVFYKCTHLSLKETRRHAQLCLAMGKLAICVITLPVSEMFTAHASLRKIGFRLQFRLVMSKSALVALLANAFCEERAHLSLGELSLISFRKLPFFTRHGDKNGCQISSLEDAWQIPTSSCEYPRFASYNHAHSTVHWHHHSSCNPKIFARLSP